MLADMLLEGRGLETRADREQLEGKVGEAPAPVTDGSCPSVSPVTTHHPCCL